MLKKFLIILIVFSLLLPIFTACSGEKPNNPVSDEKNAETPDSGETDIPESETPTERIQPNLPDDLDFGGETFTFIVTGPTYGFGYYETNDIYAEQQTGDTLNDAVYLRNRNVEAKININIAEVKSASVVNDARKAIKAGDNSYDAISAQMFENANMAQQGELCNIKQIPNIDLDKPWWDKNAEIELAIKNKLYFTESDISTLARSCTLFIIFNKKLAQEYELGNPYEYVQNGKWTFDIYANMAKPLYTDVNGNGEYDDEDIYGMWIFHHNPHYFMMGFGERMTTNDKDGIPQITWGSDRLYGAADKIYDFFFDGNACRNVVDMKPTSNFSNMFGYAREGLFANDKFLFFLGAPVILEELRNMESDFGILPMPKLDENQSRYYSPIDQFGTLLSIPVTCEDENKTGAILETMAAESMYTLRPAYYETLLKRKYVRDSESEFVLDIIFDNRIYDLELLFNWGGIVDMMNNMTIKKNRNLASEMEKIYNRMEKAITKNIDAFE